MEGEFETKTAGESLRPTIEVLPEGTVIGRRYIIERLIGGGGNGLVYKAWDNYLRDTVAIKIFYSKEMGDIQEIVPLVRKLSEPKLVKVFHVDLLGDKPYLVMEYIEGVDLKTLMEIKKFKESEKISVIIDLLNALKSLHEAGILHLDLKPSNIIITRQGQLKLLDFGISERRKVVALTPEAIRGTPTFMSPEQRRGEPVDERTDIYSVGLLIFWMLTGKNYEGTHQLEKLPLKWRRILKKALAPRKEDRFRNIEELKKEIIALTDRRKQIRFLWVFLLAISLGVILWLFSINRGKRVFRLERYNDLIIAYDSKGTPLWKKKLNLISSSLKQSYLLKDINGDGREEVILFATFGQESGPVTSLMVFDSSGKLLWKRNFDEPVKTYERTFYPPYKPQTLKAEDLNGDGLKEIVVVARHSFYPSFMTVFTSEGDKLGTLWHSGPLCSSSSALIFEDIDKDGIKEIIAGGCNTEYKNAVLFAVNPYRIEGKSPQKKGSRYDFPGRRIVKFEFYIRFPRSTLAEFFADIPEVTLILPRKRNFEITIKEVSGIGLHSSSFLLYILNKNFQPVDLEISNSFKTVVKFLNLEINFQEERRRLLNSIISWTGRSWKKVKI